MILSSFKLNTSQPIHPRKPLAISFRVTATRRLRCARERDVKRTRQRQVARVPWQTLTTRMP